MHRRERHTTSNTGRLALVGLEGADLWIRGFENQQAIPPNALDSHRRLLVLYPCEEAITLDSSFREKYPGPYQLVVPDGSWRQAAKVPKREVALAQALRVKVNPPRASLYQLRREPKAEGLATLEAIAFAMEHLESLQCREHLERLFLEFVRRTLEGRPDTSSPST
jgi:DTW domain-containing protein YfiP